MKRLWPKGAALALVALAAAVVAATAGAVTPTVVYDNIPSPQPGNVPSIAFEANAISEWGGQIQLAGTQRQNPTITVLMSSWGCVSGHWYSGDCSTPAGSTFSEPITLKLYNVASGGNVGSLIATTTQTFNIPYRPSASPTCGDGRWYDGTSCFNGYGTQITFNPLTGVTLPNKLIASVAYNTSHYGYAPYGEATACYTSAGGCGYDSLNVGTNPAPTTGTDPQPDDAYLNAAYGYEYCDNGLGGAGTFRLDSGCWTGYQPAIRVAALYVNEAKTQADCKNDGWKTHTRADGSTFKNQGDCIQYVNTGK